MGVPPPLPDDVSKTAAFLKEYSGQIADGGAPQQLAGFIARGSTSEIRADRMLAIRNALGKDDRGGKAFDQVLAAGQSPIFVLQSGVDVGARMHEAFRLDVKRGAITASDVRAIADREAAIMPLRDLTSQETAIGSNNSALATHLGRLSSYVEALGTDSRSQGARDAFFEASVAHAFALRDSSPVGSSQLYAQAANALAGMASADVQRRLDALHANDPNGIVRFAAGATAGTADRATTVDYLTDAHERIRADGLARVINVTTSAIVAAQEAGRTNAPAEAANAQLFTGVAHFLTVSRGTDLDRSLGENDSRTGLRDAMNGAMQHNFPTILRQNSFANGQGLIQPGGGFDTFSSYARFEFGAPNDARGRATTDRAQHIVAQIVGTIQGDLLKAARDGGRDLARDFGPGTFGVLKLAEENAAFENGELFGAFENGINQNFDARADRNAANQEVVKATFETASNVAGMAGIVAGEKLGTVPEIAEKAADLLEGRVPAETTTDTGRISALRDTSRKFAEDLGMAHPERRLTPAFEQGRAMAGAQWSEYETDREHQKLQTASHESQEGILSLALAATMPSPEEPPAISAPMVTDAAMIRESTRRAVEAYNETHAGTRLPMPAPDEVGRVPSVRPWDGSALHGTVLQIGPDEFAVNTGRGQYQVLTPNDTNGVRPISGVVADIGRDGSVHQDVRGATALDR